MLPHSHIPDSPFNRSTNNIKKKRRIGTYQQHKKEKKDRYSQSVIDIEKSSFKPLIFITSGGIVPELQNVPRSTKDY